MVVATAGNLSMGAVLTFVVPILTLMAVVGYGYHQRKPPAARSPRGLFPFEGLPEHTYDLERLSAMSGRARAEVARRPDDGSPLSERPTDTR
ncbi:MAG: hypothetical protein ACYCV7_04840 [Acidimicrobiales bacterium]